MRSLTRWRDAREVVGGFVEWLDRYGETSQDQYDFWGTRF